MLPLLLLALAVDFQHAIVDSGGVQIHYAAYGKPADPLVVMIHGFPDFWYTWRDQMRYLGDRGYFCVAMDLRGYNLSGQPTGIENYDMRLLIGDVLSVIKANRRQKAIILAHDWGGAIAWNLALNLPQAVDKLIVLNLPHPRGLSRELATNPAQQKASEYARRFQQPDSHQSLSPESLSSWVRDNVARDLYIEAFRRSSFPAMMAYYQQNYPRPPYRESQDERRLAMPVLLIHGLKDQALLPAALNNTWDWVDDLTLLTIPEAGHFVQQDATEKVSRAVKSFLERDR